MCVLFCLCARILLDDGVVVVPEPWYSVILVLCRLCFGATGMYAKQNTILVGGASSSGKSAFLSVVKRVFGTFGVVISNTTEAAGKGNFPFEETRNHGHLRALLFHETTPAWYSSITTQLRQVNDGMLEPHIFFHFVFLH